MECELETFMCVAVNLTKEVGEIIKERIWKTKQSIQTKAHLHDFVTETDQQVEKLLITGLSSEFPTHKFIGEETTSSGVKVELSDEPTWIIDPVDGTLNFVHGYPNVCVSIGLAVQKKIVLGIIYVPVNNMLFTAIKGKGAFLNEQPIHVSRTSELKDALLVMEFSGAATNEERLKCALTHAKAFLPLVHGIRSAGSAAFNMAMVALGGADVYFETGIHAWDMAAGLIIVEEAGGVVLDPSGNQIDIMSRRMLCAGTKELALEVAKSIIQVYPTRDDA